MTSLSKTLSKLLKLIIKLHILSRMVQGEGIKDVHYSRSSSTYGLSEVHHNIISGLMSSSTYSSSRWDVARSPSDPKQPNNLVFGQLAY